MAIAFKLIGGEELVRRLNAMPARVSKKIQVAALKEAGEPMRAAMATNAPRGDRTPHLADNIKILVTRTGDRDEFGVAIGPTREVFWGGYQEFGTKHQPARPFARPAFDSHVERVLSQVSRKLWDAIRKQEGTATGASPGGVGNL